jgi:hypothetical protein
MNTFARIVRVLLFIPIIVFVSPALILLGFLILLMETKEASLRTLFQDEVKAYGFFKGYERFMQNVFVPTYRHNIQSFVLGGAGFLVITVGLRSLGVLSTDVVYVALGVEFTLLVVWAITMYFTPEEEISEDHKILRERAVEDKYEMLAIAMRELNTHLALLESRLQIMERKFEKLSELDSSMNLLTTKLDLLVGEQFNLRVKKEFEQLVAELGGRITAEKSAAS